jgi:hypothetical protein
MNQPNAPAVISYQINYLYKETKPTFLEQTKNAGVVNQRMAQTFIIYQINYAYEEIKIALLKLTKKKINTEISEYNIARMT